MTTAETYSILIVEDNPDIVIGLEDLLQHDGYVVTVAGTCASAFAQLKMQRFKAILLDLGLPDGDGLDVLREVQRVDASLPVIIITAHIAPERTVGSLAKGAFAYLTKPYDKEELRQTLRRAIGVKELAVKAARAEQSLTESEHRFRSLVESASDAIIVANGRGAIVSWNRAASQMFGYAAPDIIGKPLTTLMPVRYRGAHEKGLARMEATGESRVIGTTVELHGLRNNGEEFPIELSLATWKTATGSYYSGIIRDISERKKAELVHVQLQRQYSLILNQAGEGIYGIDADGNTTFVNPSAAGMLGYRVEELVGRHMHEVLHYSRPDGTPYPLESCPVYAAIRDGVVHRVFDEVFWRKDGTSFPVEYVSTPIIEAGKVSGAVVVFHDITDRLNAEQALRRSQQLLQEIANNTTAVIYVKDLDGRFIFVNRRFLEIFDLTSEQIIGRTNHEVFPPAIADPWRANDLQVLEARRSLEYEEDAPHIDGVHTYLSIKLPLYDQTGTPYATCGISTDITERKRMETLMRTHEEQLAQALRSTETGGWVWDLESGRLCWSRQVDKLFGTPEEAHPHTEADLLALVHPDDRTAMAKAMNRVHESAGDYVDFEHRALCRDGTMRSFVWTGQVIRDRTEKIIQIMGMVRATTTVEPLTPKKPKRR